MPRAFALLLALLVASPALAAEESICVVTHVDATPNFTVAARDLLRAYVDQSRKEPGATRVEVFEELARPNHSTIVSVWKDRKSFDAHLASETTRTWRGKLQPMLRSPFDERLHRLTP